MSWVQFPGLKENESKKPETKSKTFLERDIQMVKKYMKRMLSIMNHQGISDQGYHEILPSVTTAI